MLLIVYNKDDTQQWVHDCSSWDVSGFMCAYLDYSPLFDTRFSIHRIKNECIDFSNVAKFEFIIKDEYI